MRETIKNTAWILKHSWQYAPFLTLAQLFGDLNNAVGGLLRAWIWGIIIDFIALTLATNSGPITVQAALVPILAFGGYYLFTSIGGVLSNYGNNLSHDKLGDVLPQNLLLEKLNALGPAALESPKVQNLVNRFREHRWLFMNMTNRLFIVFSAFVVLIIAFIPLVQVIPWVTLALVVAVIPSYFYNKQIINKLWQLSKDTTVEGRRSDSMTGMLGNPASLKEINLLNGYQYLRGYFDKYIVSYIGKKVEIYGLWAVYDILNTILLGSIMCVGLYQLISLVGAITPGQVVFYSTSLLYITNYVDNLSSNLTSYLGASQRVSDARDLLEYPVEVESKKKKFGKLEAAPLLEFRNVSFSYPGSDRLVTNNVDFTIKSGEKVAIVGENGAGKTTLVKLISGIYPATQGKILVNDENLADFSTRSWFQNLGVLYQDYNTYDDLTVWENIALGQIQDKLDMERVMDAAKKADAHEFIMQFPEQYNQILSERYEGGTRPSTGQWQKIAIARFFYRAAPILILDEPTASIDAVAEANIFDRIYEFIQDKTVIIVSHRFSTVRNADRIIVLDGGQIVEQGSHDELMANDGKYAHAFRLQAKGYN
jgi:ATP-binding cassette subfamily B protein